ncbi:hypothetical protein GCM10022245_07810 [Streptomyces mayteni]
MLREAAREFGVAGIRPALRWRDGVWVTGVAMKLAGPAGLPAREVAERLGERLRAVPGVRGVGIGGGGFLEVGLEDRALVGEILRRARPAAVAEDPARDAGRWVAVVGGRDALVQREGNPLFRVRYAQARARGLVREAGRMGLTPEPGHVPGEGALVGALGEHPWDGEPTRVARSLVRVADAFGGSEAMRRALPWGDEKPLAVHRSRLALAQAAGVVLVDGLTRLGVSAPEHV